MPTWVRLRTELPLFDLSRRPARPAQAWLARQLYSLLLRLGTPLYLWRVWSRGRQEPDYRADWPARLGFNRTPVTCGAGPLVWVHAVSLGEARAAAPLVRALRQACPGMRLLLTHTTATGREAGRALLEEGDLQTWLPWDTPGSVRRFLRHFQPDVGVLMETEVWPNLLHIASRQGLPVALANARLSDKSLRQGRRFSALLRPAAQALSACLAQTEADAVRLEAMGASAVQVCGNVKFDMTPQESLLALGRAWRQASQRPLILAASTREGEEALLLEAWCARPQADVDADGEAAAGVPRLVLVPRHPQRFDEVAELVSRAGLTLSRRSTWPQNQPDAQALEADVWLGDSMGEMPAYYAACKVAMLGGSFANLGGQNLIEAAACACPVVMGPSTFNFAEAAELSEAAGAAFRVADASEGVQRACALCVSGADQAAVAALGFAAAHRGAARRAAAAITGLLRGRFAGFPSGLTRQPHKRGITN